MAAQAWSGPALTWLSNSIVMEVLLLQLLHLHGLQLKNEDWKRLIKATFNLQHILPLDNTAGISTQIPGFDLSIEYFMIHSHGIGAIASGFKHWGPHTRQWLRKTVLYANT